MKDSVFYKQAELMLTVLPDVMSEECFALKGGTAINLFLRDMPRLSVDIDLTYLPLGSRASALTHLGAALELIAAQITKRHAGTTVHKKKSKETNATIKLVVEQAGVQVKIEPNSVIRGAAFPAEERRLTKAARDIFKLDVRVRSLSLADLYGGKICAALDRQHPRDWFDIKILLDNEGLTTDIRRAFVIYLASHNRPMSELLKPTLVNFRKVFADEFAGMPSIEVTYDELCEVRKKFVTILASSLSPAEREFLISVKRGEPQWQLSDGTSIPRLPAILWKVNNVRKMPEMKRKEATRKLSALLGKFAEKLV